MIVLSVSQTYWNRGVRRHRKGTKRIWLVYYLDEDGKLGTKHINWLQVPYYKSQIKRKRRMFCLECERVFVGFVKNDKEILKIECPRCDDPDITLLPADSIEQFEKVVHELQD